MKRREKKIYRLTIRLSARERLKLSRLADAKGTTLSGVVHGYLARLTVGAEGLHAEEEAAYQVRSSPAPGQSYQALDIDGKDAR